MSPLRTAVLELAALLAAGVGTASAPAALPAPAQQITPGQVPQEPPPLDPEEERRLERRSKQLERLLARQDLTSTFEDPEAVQRGAAMLERLLAAAGGREAWEAAQGLRLDVLETRYSVLDRVKDRWAVHHYVPRLCAFDLLGRGYVWSEFGEFQDGEPHPDFTREVYDGAVSWAEHGPQYFRAPENAVQAGSRVRKQFLLGAMPFSIPALGGKLAYARSESVMLGPAGGRAQRIGIERRAAEVDVFVLRLPFESAIVMESEGREEISEFLLLVEQGTDRVVRLQYVLTDSDRHAVQAPYTWASVDFDGVVELGALRLPKLCGQWSEDPLACNGYLTADPHAEALAPEALRKPWLGSPVFVPPFRADEWDPPADRARPEPRTGPDARRRGKRGLERGDTPRDGAGGAESEDGSDGRR